MIKFVAALVSMAIATSTFVGSSLADDLLGGRWGWTLPSITGHPAIDRIYRNKEGHAITIYSELTKNNVLRRYMFDLNSNHMIKSTNNPQEDWKEIDENPAAQLSSLRTVEVANNTFQPRNFSISENSCELNARRYRMIAGTNKTFVLIRKGIVPDLGLSDCWREQFGTARVHYSISVIEINSLPDQTFLMSAPFEPYLIRMDAQGRSEYWKSAPNIFLADAEKVAAAIENFYIDRDVAEFDHSIVSSNISADKIMQAR